MAKSLKNASLAERCQGHAMRRVAARLQDAKARILLPHICIGGERMADAKDLRYVRPKPRCPFCLLLVDGRVFLKIMLGGYLQMLFVTLAGVVFRLGPYL